MLEMFKTDTEIEFAYDDEIINFLYLNGVVDREIVAGHKRYVKFASPFVQKRLFNYFARNLFRQMGRLYEPFEKLEDTITDDSLNVKNLMRRYEHYLQKNRDWLLKGAPKRVDLRIYEAVYHFNLYMYLRQFLHDYDGDIQPEFPTGNGKIDLIVKYSGRVYGIEVKSYTNERAYRKALNKAAYYGQQLQLTEISLVLFIDYIDDDYRNQYEEVYVDKETGVTVTPIFVATGSDG